MKHMKCIQFFAFKHIMLGIPSGKKCTYNYFLQRTSQTLRISFNRIEMLLLKSILLLFILGKFVFKSINFYLNIKLFFQTFFIVTFTACCPCDWIEFEGKCYKASGKGVN